jgi:signal transduction histidine kinase
VCFLHTGEAGGGGEHSELRVIAKSGCLVDARPESTLSATVRQVIDSGHPVVIYDAVSEERGSEVVAIGCGSAVFVPMLGDEGVIGVLGLVAPQKRHFDNGTMTFVGAAANQIGLASRQAELIRRSQQQAQNLSALYRISHELSLNLSLDELFHHAFFILRDELGLERIWLGLLSEAGTRITGQAAYGPGWRRRLVNLNLEIDHSGHPLLQVVKSKSTLFLENPEKELEDVALKRVFSLMDVRSVALVPMVASGQVYGVLAVQPSATDGKLQQEELHLLSSLANELAFVLMTKRLEDRIADGEKMRAAGLFAGGIAHNFNNLLQAVMGQTSLLELQKNDPQKVERAAKLIGEVAMKGAHLVQKLMSFAQLEEPFREWCDVKELVERNFSLLERLTAPNQKLTFRSGVEVSKAFVDPQQVVRILSTIVSNASEAMPDGGPIEIETAQLSLESNPFELEAGEYVQISVRDRGRGMDPETRRRCFEPFFSTKDRDRRSGLSLTGAGLSLAAAYTLAQRNGGILSVESGERLGSVFSLLLPLSQGAAASQGEPRPSVVAGEVKATVPSNVLPLPARISRGEGESPSDNSSGGRARRGSGQK